MKYARAVQVSTVAALLVASGVALTGCRVLGDKSCGRHMRKSDCCGTCRAERARCGKQCRHAARHKEACGKTCAVPANAAVERKQGETEVSTAALKTLLDSGANVTVLDARTGKYDDGRRIPGATDLSPETSPEEAARSIESKDSLVVTYCSNLQCPASSRLAARLKELGYENVLEYPEGIQGWTEAGHSVEKLMK